VLHGGPGGGSQPSYRQYFPPDKYRIVQFDQRGCGNSTPRACLEENTTWDLVKDIETLRELLKIERWVVFGGSWGSTLALSYAETHPKRVKALILRGIFALRRSELEFFYHEGSSWLFPDHYEEYISAIPPAERGDLMSAFYRRLTSSDEKVKVAAAVAWTRWEMATSRLFIDQTAVKKGEDPAFAVTFARIESHYFVHGGWFRQDDQLIVDASVLRENKIPGSIVQGRYDMVCPAKTAWDLHRAWPEAEFFMIPDAGHSIKEPGIVDQLVRACDKYADAK